MSFSSSSGKKSGAHDMTTKSQLTNLFNQPVVRAEHVTRSMAHIPKSITHEGVRVTTQGGSQYLIHKGSNYGVHSDTVVVDAKHMLNNWNVASGASVSGKTVSDYVEAGGKNYSLVTDKGKHAASRMKNLSKPE